jgi:hypothetical protein
MEYLVYQRPYRRDLSARALERERGRERERERERERKTVEASSERR